MARRFYRPLYGALSAVLVTTLWVTAAAADDPDTCRKGSGEVAISACTRAITSGQYHGLDLALLFYNRADRYRAMSYRSGPGTADRRRFALLAVPDFTEAIRLRPQTNPLYFVNRSNAYALAGDALRAINDLDEALRLDPADENDALVNRCNLRGEVGQFEAALADCTKFLSGKRENLDIVYALMTRGHVFLRMAKFDQSLADYEAALKIVESSDTYYRSRCLIGRGLAKLKKGNGSDGMEDIAEGKKVDATAVYDFQGFM